MQKNGGRKSGFRSGVTIVELVTAFTVSSIVILAAGIVLAAGHKNWSDTYDLANAGIRADAINTMIAFGAMGRKSNKSEYRVYQVSGGQFTRAIPPSTEPISVVKGQAVVFRYWDTELNESIINGDSGRAYALFYQDGDMLNVDYGLYPPGVDELTSRNTGLAVKTITLAKNVENLEFSHKSNLKGDGNGCVKMDMTLRDEKTGRTLTIKTATLIRSEGYKNNDNND